MLHGTPLLRWLQQLGPAALAQASQAPPTTFAEQLGPWLGWAEAIALASTLQAPAKAAQAGTTAAPPASAAPPDRARQEAAAARRVYEELSQMINSSTAPQADTPPGLASRRMHERVTAVRARLRATLAACSPALRPLAELDQALEHALSAREQQLLATLPGLFKQHQAQAQGEDITALRKLLLAELQARWQPVAGLLEALEEHLANAWAPPA